MKAVDKYPQGKGSRSEKVAALSGEAVARLACLQHCKRDFVSLQGNPYAADIPGLNRQGAPA